MRRIKLTVAYDGTNYCGWQIQPNGITIEEVLNKAITALTGTETTVIGASRTDSGVHALGNVAVFDTGSRIPAERFSYALNQRLPKDILVVKSEEVPLDWHPRYQDSLKTYEYHIINSRVQLPTQRLYHYFVGFELDVERMREGAACLLGEHDFASFCCIRTNAKTTVRKITDLQIHRQGDEIVIRVTGNGFLYNMVRIIAGILIRVGRGFYEPEKVKEILDGRERTREAVTAPAQGLFLVEIAYGAPEEQIVFRRAEDADIPAVMRMMDAAVSGLPNPDWFAVDDEETVRRHVEKEGFILLAEHVCGNSKEPAAFLIVRFPGKAEDNLGTYLELSEEDMSSVAHLETAVVAEAFRGRKLQYQLFLEAQKLLEGGPYKYLMATVHPENKYSLSNMEKLGCKKAVAAIKYGGKQRLVMWKELGGGEFNAVNCQRQS